MSIKQRLTALARKMAPRGRMIVVRADDGQEIDHLLVPLGVTSADLIVRLRSFADNPTPPQISAIWPIEG